VAKRIGAGTRRTPVDHSGVEAVLYPGLPGFPGHDLAKQQMPGRFNGMLSVRINGGAAAAIAVAANVPLWKRATSLGGVESLIGLPDAMSRASVPEARRRALGITPQLLRLSVGIEAADDLIADLDRALG